MKIIIKERAFTANFGGKVGSGSLRYLRVNTTATSEYSQGSWETSFSLLTPSSSLPGNRTTHSQVPENIRVTRESVLWPAEAKTRKIVQRDICELFLTITFKSVTTSIKI